MKPPLVVIARVSPSNAFRPVLPAIAVSSELRLAAVCAIVSKENALS
jgi:hypothetical protein